MAGEQDCLRTDSKSEREYVFASNGEGRSSGGHRAKARATKFGCQHPRDRRLAMRGPIAGYRSETDGERTCSVGTTAIVHRATQGSEVASSHQARTAISCSCSSPDVAETHHSRRTGVERRLPSPDSDSWEACENTRVRRGDSNRHGKRRRGDTPVRGLRLVRWARFRAIATRPAQEAPSPPSMNEATCGDGEPHAAVNEPGEATRASEREKAADMMTPLQHLRTVWTSARRGGEKSRPVSTVRFAASLAFAAIIMVVLAGCGGGGGSTDGGTTNGGTPPPSSPPVPVVPGPPPGGPTIPPGPPGPPSTAPVPPVAQIPTNPSTGPNLPPTGGGPTFQVPPPTQVPTIPRGTNPGPPVPPTTPGGGGPNQVPTAPPQNSDGGGGGEPVPEPSTWILMSVGVAVVGFAAARQGRTAGV